MPVGYTRVTKENEHGNRWIEISLDQPIKNKIIEFLKENRGIQYTSIQIRDAIFSGEEGGLPDDRVLQATAIQNYLIEEGIWRKHRDAR